MQLNPYNLDHSTAANGTYIGAPARSFAQPAAENPLRQELTIQSEIKLPYVTCKATVHSGIYRTECARDGRSPTYVPRARNRVQIASRRGMFMVIHVDRDRERADVVSEGDREFLEENVPYSAIRPYKQELPPEAE
jgi:hypothetical protein